VLTSDRGRELDEAPRLQSTLLLEETGLGDYGFVYISQSHRVHDEFILSHPAPFDKEEEEGEKEEKGEEREKKDPYTQVRRLSVTRHWRAISGIGGC
jgi:hypothetical protein